MMLRRKFLMLVVTIISAVAGSMVFKHKLSNEKKIIELPEPRKTGKISVEEAIARRRSRRSYSDKPISLSDISQLCWAAQGITDPIRKFRAAPSAGALYPIELFLVVGNAEIEAGVYQYIPFDHSLMLIKRGDYREDLYKAALRQEAVRRGAIDIVITAIYERTTRKYGERGIRYVHMEAGHVAQNIYLQAEALGLGTVSIGAFYDGMVREVLSLPKHYAPLYIMPIGYR